MFRHQGNTRTFSHNKKIASLLSLVAGMVNIAGLLSVQRLTTNLTGHSTFFISKIFTLQLHESFIYFLYIVFFFLGSFVSSFLIEAISRKGQHWVFVIPTVIESIVLLLIALFGEHLIPNYSDTIAFSLLFAMGLQNSLVTKISGAIVRTTHLTGIFTDLGIELSQLFFCRTKEQKDRLIPMIMLHVRIIICFLLGGVLSNVFYPYLALYVLVIPATLLLLGLFYESIKLSLMKKNRI
jgi:uncharacterized membrane protein YoaK (UPF0700 family)